MNKKSIAILGGGLAGVYAAYRLSCDGHRIELFEKNDQLGGLAGSIKVGKVYLEKFYHHLFETDRAAKQLIEELKLSDSYSFKSVSTALLLDNQTYPLNRPLDLLKLKPLTIVERLRTGMVMAYLKKSNRWQKISNIYAKDWLERWQGKKSFQLIWEPLFRSKFGQSWEKVSMAWFWARIHFRSFKLGYIEGGFQRLFMAMEDVIRKNGAKINLKTEVTNVRRDEPNNRLVVESQEGKKYFDIVISTLPETLIGKIFPDLDQDYIATYTNHQNLGAQVLILLLNQKLLDHYWLNINDPAFPFLVAVDQSHMVSPAEYDNAFPIYFGNYLNYDDLRWTMSQNELLKLFLPFIKKLNSHFSEDWIQDAYLFKEKAAQFVVTPGYQETILPFKLPIKNCYATAMSQIYPQDRGMNYSLVWVDKLIKLINKDLAR